MDGQMDTHMTELCLKSIPLFSSLLPTPPVLPFAYLLPLREGRSKLVVERVRSIFPLE